MRWWKVIGLAGLAGVAATGAVIARDERHRASYSPDEVRERLHERASEALAGEPGATEPLATASGATETLAAEAAATRPEPS